MRCRFLDMRSCQCTVPLTTITLHEYTSGQGEHGRPRFCPLRAVPSACRPHCMPTQLWPSWGIKQESAFLIEIPGKIYRAPPGNLCQVYSVSASQVCVFRSSRASQRLKDLHLTWSQWPSNIVIWYIFKSSAASIPDALRSILGWKYRAVNAALKTDLTVRHMSPCMFASWLPVWEM